MKRHYLASCILSGVYLLSGMQRIPVHGEESGLSTGRFRSYEEYENAAHSGRLIAANESLAPEVKEVLPIAFDLRSWGLVSSVKDQEDYGMCWSFSAVNSLESQLIAKKPDIDLSEWHLAYYTYSQKFGFPLANGTDIEDVFQQGGNYYMMSPMLTSWTGPVSEAVFPFNDMSVLNPDLNWEEVKAMAEYHTSGAEVFNYYIGDENFLNQVRAVKQAVYQGNSLSMSYYHKNSYYKSSTYGYYNADDNRTGGTYHAVSIVGWDDDFPASSFNQTAPGDGAWLIKNSWGADWGDNGYFWMSYYEPTMLDFYYLKAEPFEKHDKIYQYDDYGYWTAFSVTSADESAWIANVFTAEEDTYLTSVMLCTVMPDEQYSIQIYQNPKRSSNPTSGEAAAYAEGMLSTAGYHMIDLPEAVELHEGEKFSIVVNLSGKAGQHITCESYTESTVKRSNGSVSIEKSMLTEEMIRSDFHEGESFYSADGRKWYDIYEEEPFRDSYTISDGTTFETYAMIGNACIRGLTKKAGEVIFSEDCEALSAGTEISLSTADGAEIYYSINGSEYMLYTEPLIMPWEDTNISAYAVSESGEQWITEKNYALREAQISSLLMIRDKKAKYLEFDRTANQKYTVWTNKLKAGEYISFMPISTGEVLTRDEWLVSGKMMQVYPDETGIVTLYVSESGMSDTVYEIHFSEEEYAVGDVNRDGAINAADAAEILVYAAESGAGIEVRLSDELWLERADYNADGVVNAYDASEVLVYAAEQGAFG